MVYMVGAYVYANIFLRTYSVSIGVPCGGAVSGGLSGATSSSYSDQWIFLSVQHVLKWDLSFVQYSEGSFNYLRDCIEINGMVQSTLESVLYIMMS